MQTSKPDASSKTKRNYRIVILTALPVEYAAVRQHILPESLRELVHEKGTVYEQGVFKGSKVDWEVSLVEVGAGNEATAFEVERAIATFRPAVVLFVGVAGGVKDVAIGDVVFSTKIYGYESGKADKMFLLRPSVGESSYALEQRARVEARKLDWIARIQKLSPNMNPRVFVGPIAAGEKVLASRSNPNISFPSQELQRQSCCRDGRMRVFTCN